MGCISSKILTRSGSLQEKASSYHGFQRSSSQLIEDIILSSSNSKPKTNGDQPTFLALLRTTSSSSAARKSRVDAAAEQSPASAATPAAAAKIETIDVSELLAGLEEEEQGREDRGEASPGCVPDDGAAAGRARSFRTVEEFDALVMTTRCSGSPEQPAPGPERDASVAPPESGSREQEDPATAAAAAAPARRARARQLRELSAQPEAAGADFDFGKSGSLRDWLRGGGQIFSPGSYLTPKFGNENNGGCRPRHEEHGGRPRHEEHGATAVFDPELVAQLELAMEELSVDEERVMREVLESLDAGEKKREEAERLELLSERPLKDQALPLVAYLQD
uniref:Uncharacterized protein n=1 Tax=Brachypodium sylvaticum TaxID=29664 RepID=Q2L3A7_BRASY|nr:hypothetical protein [Brachypodium sylvaticum]